MAKDSQDSTLEQEALQNGATGTQPSGEGAANTNPTDENTAETTPLPEATETEADKGASATPTEVEQAPETTVDDEKEQAMALTLMKEVNVPKIWRTAVDGYWFSKEDMANQHHKKVGGELKVFVNNEKK